MGDQPELALVNQHNHETVCPAEIKVVRGVYEGRQDTGRTVFIPEPRNFRLSDFRLSG